MQPQGQGLQGCMQSQDGSSKQHDHGESGSCSKAALTWACKLQPSCTEMIGYITASEFLRVCDPSWPVAGVLPWQKSKLRSTLHSLSGCCSNSLSNTLQRTELE
jgi:hypothetical protein